MALQTKTINHGDYAYKSWSNGYVISLTLTEESTDTSANTSLVKYLFTISNTNNNRFVDGNYSWSISIGGHTIPINSFTFNLGENYTTQTIASGTIPVAHKADGSLDMPYNVSIPNVQSGNKYGPPAMSMTGTWALTTIPRASTFVNTSGTVGGRIGIQIFKAGENLTHTLTYTFGGLSGTIATNTSLNIVPFDIPTSFYAEMPNDSHKMCTVVCTTYNGSTAIGEYTGWVEVYVDESDSRPTLNATVVDTNEATKALTGNDPNKLIRYFSNVVVTADYSPHNGASIENYTLTHNGKQYHDDTVTIEAVESGTFTFNVVDSRGFSTEPSPVVIPKEIVPYFKPTCNLSDNKPDASGHMDVFVNGNWFNGNFGAVDNELTVKYRYKVSTAQWLDTDEEWHTMVATKSGDSYTASASIEDLEYRNAYTFQAQAEDKLCEVNSNAYTARAIPVFDWGENDFQFNVPVKGITADMVGARYISTTGANLLEELRAESGLLFAKDGGNSSSYYLGLFYGYQTNTSTPVFQAISANTLSILANKHGTVEALNAVGEVTYVVIPFTQIQ